ncbi:MAG: hypothetical protein PF545_03990 [Elusimicrobia bacterium]|nr:hypothetical protein [Elusimicrobiota bacterium]
MFYKIKITAIFLLIYAVSFLNAGRFSDAGEWLNINPSPRAAAMGIS